MAKIIKIWLICAIFSTITGCEQEPETFEDCVLEKIDGVSGGAERLLYRVCRDKFPKEVKLTPVPYDPWEVEKVEDAPQFDEDDFEIVEPPE